MIVIVWIINDIHIEFNDIHWEGCLHITRRSMVWGSPQLTTYHLVLYGVGLAPINPIPSRHFSR